MVAIINCDRSVAHGSPRRPSQNATAAPDNSTRVFPALDCTLALVRRTGISREFVAADFEARQQW